MLKLDLLGTTLECLLDSGFAGGILVPFPTFESLGFLTDLTRDEYSAVMPDRRTVPLFTSNCISKIGPIEVEVPVHSSPALGDKTLAGRQFLRHLRTVMDGPRQVLSVSIKQ